MALIKEVRLGGLIQVCHINTLRFGALLFDWFFSFFIGLVVYAIAALMFYSYFSSLEQLGQIEWFLFFQIVSKPFYFIVSEFLYGNTLGKRVFGIQVVNLREGRGTLFQMTLRYVLCVLHYFTYGISLLWPIFNQKHLSLHEQLSNTKVIKIQKSVAKSYMDA
jgi:uncharacterized RDD family membrane protein YckC